ncbi:MAG: TonB-dependent receptor [Calditrichaeota bacterium]|nr:TonB-dependent receptor [Calditrichota bacterium]
MNSGCKSALRAPGIPGIILLGLFLVGALWAQTATISGYVVDAETGEKLIGANVYNPGNGLGTTTNGYGYFSLVHPRDSVLLVVSYLGYQTRELRFYLDQDLELTISLHPVPLPGEAVEVVAESEPPILSQPQTSQITIPVLKVRTIPALLGEADVLKVIQLLPGVQPGMDGTSGIFVRGGSPDQNLVLLDDATLYNVFHGFGFFSIFHSEALKSVRFIKGGFPARYGGRLSSVIDVRLKDGNLKQFSGKIDLGIISSSIFLEGPLKKEKTSFMIAARRTYADLLLRPFFSREEGVPGYYFTDVNAKLQHIFSSRDRIFLSTYWGKDELYFYQDNSGFNLDYFFGWGNITSTLRWNHIFTPRLFANIMLLFSRYEFATGFSIKDIDEDLFASIKYSTGIEDISFKMDLDYTPNPAHFLRFGTEVLSQRFNTGTLNIRGDIEQSVDPELKKESLFLTPVWKAAFYLEDEWTVNEQLRVNAGLRYDAYRIKKRTFQGLQPRISMAYRFRPGWSLKGSYSLVKQFIHLLTNNQISLPTDLWMPATPRALPENAHQIVLGMVHQPSAAWTFSLESYYKTLSNVLEFKPGVIFSRAKESWEDYVYVGRGQAYGLEVFIEKKQGKSTGWVSYTLSWANRQFDEINNGEPFPFKYDRRHNLAITFTRRLGKKWETGFTWIIRSGERATLPIATYTVIERIPGVKPDWYMTRTVHLYSKRNGFQLPVYHRLDVTLRFYPTGDPRKSSLTLSIYNLYNRKNAAFVYVDQDFPSLKGIPKQVSLFPLIPSLSLSIAF